jgi:ribose 5-phosphate isomerase A
MHSITQRSSRRLLSLRAHVCSSAGSDLSPIESAKRKAAFAAVDEFVKDGDRVGVGSGSTIVYAVERLAERAKSEGLKIVCVPTGFQSMQLVREAGLTLVDLSTHPELDIAIDGADEVDGSLNCIKGGGACQTQEKIVASCASKFVIIADYRKDSQHFGQQWAKGVPIEVLPSAYVPVSRKLEAMGGTPTLRMAIQKAGPVVTDNGNFVLDVVFDFSPGKTEPVALNEKLINIPGIVETGLFVRMAQKAFFGQEDGSVITRMR